MKILNLADNEFAAVLKGCAAVNSLVPIIGAGFTLGESTASGVSVPGGGDFKKMMISEILKSDVFKGKSDNDLMHKAFSNISEYFFNDRVVPKETRNAILEKCFTDVNLSEIKKCFLRAGWPYIYTLNVDDAIERATSYFVVTPYKSLSESGKKASVFLKCMGMLSMN